jgi:hypothetical protein
VGIGIALLAGGALPSLDFADENKDQVAVGLSPELRPPVRLEADGKPIDTDVGHAAPHLADIDGDGKLDLLVGQFGDGILWIYKNIGSNTAPRYAAGVQFKGGKEDGRVPTA